MANHETEGFNGTPGSDRSPAPAREGGIGIADLTLAERQVLALVLVLLHRPQDWETGAPVTPTHDALRRHAPLFFGDALADWSTAFESLARKGLLEDTTPCELTTRGLPLARRLRRRFVREGYGTRLARSARSAAYGEFCTRVFGIDLRQFSLLDSAQLTALLSVLDVQPGHRVLDVGCGNGLVTEHVARMTGAHLTGVDIATPAIVSARMRTRDQRHRVRFQVADLHGPLRLPLRFDRVFAIDVLYLVDALDDTVGQLLSCLRPGGRLAILASDLLPDATRAPADPSRTRMYRALSGHGLSVDVIDFTQNEVDIWREQVTVARELTPTFLAEGNGDLARELVREATRSLAWVAEGRVRRYLYHVVTPI